MNQKVNYANFCKDLYEKYDDLSYSNFSGPELWNIYPNFNYARWQWMNPREEVIWYNEFTGELCLKLRKARRTIFEKPFRKKLTNRIGLNFQRKTLK